MTKTITAIQPATYLMALATISILACLLFANQAQANARSSVHPHSQTISHCGALYTRPTIYARHTRPWSDSRNTRIIQQKLQLLGYSVGRSGTDGKFGRYTRRALSQFQSDYGLRRDGVVGEHTARTLAFVSHPLKNVRRCPYYVRPNAR